MKIHIELELAQVNQVTEILSHQPYRAIANLIESIRWQAIAQVATQEKKDETPPAA